MLPNPTSSGIEHIVVVMMENRSFDHLLGWLLYDHTSVLKFIEWRWGLAPLTARDA